MQRSFVASNAAFHAQLAEPMHTPNLELVLSKNACTRAVQAAALWNIQLTVPKVANKAQHLQSARKRVL